MRKKCLTRKYLWRLFWSERCEMEEMRRKQAAVKAKERRDGAWGAEEAEREREKEAEKQRAVVDNTAIIHLSDSLPNAPLGETQRCVTSNAQHKHTCLHTCAYTYRGNTCLWLRALGQWRVAGHSRSVHTPLHRNLYKHKSQPQASVTHSHMFMLALSLHANIYAAFIGCLKQCARAAPMWWRATKPKGQRKQTHKAENNLKLYGPIFCSPTFSDLRFIISCKHTEMFQDKHAHEQDMTRSRDTGVKEHRCVTHTHTVDTQKSLFPSCGHGSLADACSPSFMIHG